MVFLTKGIRSFSSSSFMVRRYQHGCIYLTRWFTKTEC